MTGTEWHLVESSNVLGFAFDLEGQVDVEPNEIWGSSVEYGSVFVAFKSGEVYRYSGVTKRTFNVLCDADSAGRAVNALLRNRECERAGQVDLSKVAAK